jgi:phytoene dehydrogenase-like protein
MQDTYDVAIIGSGMGGLSCGAWLAHMGMKVLVVEQNVQVGGLCSTYKRNGFSFSPAASIITGATKKNGVFPRLTKRLGIEDKLEFLPLEQGYHVHFPDFNYYLYSGGVEARGRLIEQIVGLFPHEADGIKAFFKTLVRLYEQADYATFLGTSPRDVARILLKCPTVVRHMNKGIVPFVRNFVTDPKLRSVLSINSTCANLPPSQMSVLGIGGLLIEGGLSNPHVKGGSQAVPEAFAAGLRDSGGEVLLGHLVEKILVEDKKAFGIRLAPSPLARAEGAEAGSGDRKEIKAKYIVSNAAARQTFQKLVGEEAIGTKFLKNLNKLRPTPPCGILLLGLDMDLKKMGMVPALHIHSSNYDVDEHFKNVERKMVGEQGPEPFFRFQLAPLSDPTSAPEGKSALAIHGIPAPIGGCWEDEAYEKKAIDMMIKRAEKIIPDLSKNISYQEFWSPTTLDKYALSGQDATMGWALSPDQTGPKRLAPQTPIKNLFLSGHWTRPALGVMSTVISGLQTSRMILSREGIKEPLADIGIEKGVAIN